MMGFHSLAVRADGEHSAGSHRDWWTLHVWLHLDNPEVLFAPFNHNFKWDQLPTPPQA